MKILYDPGDRPYDYFHRVMGGKWKMFIIRGIHQNGFIRFNEAKRILGVSGKFLQQQLRDLERDGIIDRIVYPVMPPHVEYVFTPAGKELVPVLDSIYEWSTKRMQELQIPIALLSPVYHKKTD